MIDPREKQLDNFISNIGKSTEKPVKRIDNDLDISFGEGFLFVAIVCALWFITYMVV